MPSAAGGAVGELAQDVGVPGVSDSWTFVVRAAPGGGSRLVVRERVAFGSRLAALVIAPIGFPSFVMSRAMLIGVKSRAEAAA